MVIIFALMTFQEWQLKYFKISVLREEYETSKQIELFKKELTICLHQELIKLGKFKINFVTNGKYMGLSLNNEYNVSVLSYRDGRTMITIQVKNKPEDIVKEWLKETEKLHKKVSIKLIEMKGKRQILNNLKGGK